MPTETGTSIASLHPYQTGRYPIARLGQPVGSVSFLPSGSEDIDPEMAIPGPGEPKLPGMVGTKVAGSGVEHFGLLGFP